MIVARWIGRERSTECPECAGSPSAGSREMSSTGKRRGLAVTGRSTRARPSAPDPEAAEGDQVRGVAQHPDLVEAAAADARQAADRQLHGGAAQPGVGVRAARPVAHGRERDLARRARRRRRRRRRSARRRPRRGRRAPARRRPRRAGRSTKAGAATGARRRAAAARARAAGDRRSGGAAAAGSHSSRPERAQLRGRRRAARAGMSSSLACHAPSASIISRRRRERRAPSAP